jgi:DNA repair photolyase
MPRSAEPRALEAHVRELLGPLLRLEVPSRTGWRLVGWDADAGLSLTLGKDDRLLLVEIEPRDDARDCLVRTDRFNVCARHAFRADRPLTDEERRVAAQVAGIVGARSTSLPVVDRAAPSSGSEVREVTVERVLVAEGAGHYYVNPYTGCMIGCTFCYVAHRADMTRALESRPALPWGRYVDVKINAAEVLRRETAIHAPGIVRISPIVTDPYQPLERRYRITRQCLEVLGDAGFTPVVLTRAARVVDDLQLLARIPRAAVGLSIPTDDDSVRRVFEPGADPIEMRLEALERCHRAGVITFGVVQPMLPMDPDRLVAAMAPFVRCVRVDRMHEMARARRLYEQAGRLDATNDAFFERMATRLIEGFTSRGVLVDSLDDLSSVVSGSLLEPSSLAPRASR